MPGILFTLVLFFAQLNCHAKVTPFEQYIFRQQGHVRTDALIVWKKGKILFEKYDNGYTKDSSHFIWSATKSISSLVFGKAQELGLVHKDDLLSKYLKVPTDKKEIRLVHLLEMRSGIDWKEKYETSPFNSHVVRMISLELVGDIGNYVLKISQKFKPGEKFHYSSGDTNLLMKSLKMAMGNKDYDYFPWKYIFDPMGMESVTWERDGSGTFVGSSLGYMTARDFLKLGIMLINRGKYRGKQIISPEWIDYVTGLNRGFIDTAEKPDGKQTYGAQFWLNRPAPKAGLERPYKNAPEDLYFASGHEGQYLFVIPSKNMVVARMASDIAPGLDFDPFFEKLFTFVKELEKEKRK
jgi:CubicO group peptidase (beta-lactamase class C family)